jgi:pimeloyl-ACP methyl ester carboxylesterase
MLFAIKSSDAKAAGVGECLGRAGDEGVATALPLLDHPSRWVRDFAVDFLTRQRSAEALKALRERWEAGKGAIPRAAVLTMLAGYPTADVKDVVEAALFDTSADVRGQALDAIERSHAMDYGAKLLSVAEEDAEPALRVRALEVMWRLGDDAVVPLALRMAQYEKPEVVPMAVRVLGFMGGEGSVEVVQRLLKAKEEPVVEAAKRALWLLTYRDPAGDDRLSFRGPPEARAAEDGGVVEVPGGRVTLLGKKGPLVVVLPGGPGMDLTWARPWLDDVADDAVLAYLEPTGEEPGNGLVSAELLQAAMQAVGRDRAVLVSDWLGGTGALWLAMRVQAVKGVVALAAPLPGRLQAFDEALVAAIPEPFASLAKEVEDADARFAPAALERYMTRLMAPALAGPKVAAEKVLGVRVELGATARAYAALIRPEVAFVAGETGAKVLWLGPLSTLPEELRQAWMGTAAAAPDRLAVEDLPECGFLPSVTCRRDVVKRIERFLEDPGVAR